MVLQALPHQPRALEILGGGVRRGQVHHAYLFGGPEGAGKEDAAVRFAQALFCERDPGAGCGTCGACARVAAHAHPDMLWVMPEVELIARKLAGRTDFADSPSRDVKIDQIRKLIARLAFKPLSAPRKVAVVLRAERMNAAAQNALLKTLEEPPADTTLVLISASPDALLPTIRSRCLRVPFVPLPFEAVVERVARERKLSPPEARLCVQLAQGSLSRALGLDALRLARRRALFERVGRLSADDARPALLLAEDHAERADAEWALQMLELWLRDQLLLRSGADASRVANADLLEPLAHQAQGQAPERLLRRLEAVKAAAAHLARNASPRMQLERLFLEYVP